MKLQSVCLIIILGVYETTVQLWVCHYINHITALQLNTKFPNGIELLTNDNITIVVTNRFLHDKCK